LAKAAQFVRRFFFAVDVLSPSYAVKISRELINAGIDIKWMADFRLESTFDDSKVSIFQKAGCLGAAFGMESADQDTLNAIDKGTSVSRLEAVVHAFTDIGIPVQLMGFTGFPGETRLQAQTTFSTVGQLLGKAATAAIGKFGLTKGSLVAKNPDAYDVEILYEHAPRYSLASTQSYVVLLGKKIPALRSIFGDVQRGWRLGPGCMAQRVTTLVYSMPIQRLPLIQS
jgi:anaerobic magnesium-protoporphyrin IX monomethyl ester cyclase